jgi:hypothetical protein
MAKVRIRAKRDGLLDDLRLTIVLAKCAQEPPIYPVDCEITRRGKASTSSPHSGRLVAAHETERLDAGSPARSGFAASLEGAGGLTWRARMFEGVYLTPG